MDNKEFQFKTNINCSGCEAAVKPYLDQEEAVCEWKVDTTNKDKILKVIAEGITEDQLIDIVEKAGFKAMPLTQSV
ncbi:MAG: hypothetical protein IPQ10_08585 [Saprospiraceae bacterium]|nr:hypothetical protein [Saprospiraceae bacterium]MBK7795994.1 hypothetical protein [Saprospiraceae bacterium]MBK9378169.1 hypothetical protein [Saprospiraceae bacterium]MBL0261106.1 hypothetical protein [Saprospiraceae bacterium]